MRNTVNCSPHLRRLDAENSMREETARTVTSSASEARAHIARERDKSSSFEVLWQLAMQLKCPFTATNWTGVLSVNRVKIY